MVWSTSFLLLGKIYLKHNLAIGSSKRFSGYSGTFKNFFKRASKVNHQKEVILKNLGVITFGVTG